MSFIGQIVLSESLFGKTEGDMAYVFMNESGGADETWEPDAGKNAIIIQPGNNTIATVAEETGPVTDFNYDNDFDDD